MEPKKLLSDRQNRLILPDLQEIKTRLQTRKPPRILGDHTLNPDMPAFETYKQAAVLILLLPHHGNDFSVVFTQRTLHLSAHAGQVSFPGGRMETTDHDAAHAALRETHEETGLDPSSVRILGQMDSYITRSGFCVSPVIGYAEAIPEWRPDPREVEHIFAVPLSYIAAPENLTPNDCEDKKRYYVCTYEKFRIWGATAGMLKNFIDAIMESETSCR